MFEPIEPATCPVCSEKCPGPPTDVYTVEQAAAHFCTRQKNADRNARLERCIRRLWRRETCAILRCPACDFAFGWPYAGGDAEFYQIIHESAGYPAWRWEYDEARILAAKRFPGGGRLLDVGTGDGAFLTKLDTNWQKGATESTEVLRDQLRRKGFHVFADLEEAGREARGTFEVVTLFQVLEHISDFRPMLRGIRTLLRPGGLVILSVPDGDALPRRMNLTRYADMPPNHINKWGRKSLGIAFGQCGLRQIESKSEPDHRRFILEAAYYRMRSDAATRPDSLAAHASHSSNPVVRSLGLRAVGAATLLRVLTNLRIARMSANLLSVAEAV